jgi:hypothetical protein
MSEPENHTLRVLVEFRNEFRDFKAEIALDLAEIKAVTARNLLDKPAITSSAQRHVH